MYQDPTTGRGVHGNYGAGRYDPMVGDYVAGDPTEYWVSERGASRDARSPFQAYSPQGEYLRSGNYEPATDINKQLLKYGAALGAWGGLGSLVQGAGAGAGTAANTAQEAFRLSEIAAQNAGAGTLATAAAPNLLDKVINKATDVVTKGTGSTLLDKVIDKATTPAGLASLAALLAGTASGGGGGGGGYAGYSGGIPELRATRTQYANDPTRRPGGAPQQYFSDNAYTSDMNGPGLVQASDPTAGAWQAGNVPEVNRLLGANKPTLQKLIEAYNLSPADIEFLKTRGVKLPSFAAGGITSLGAYSDGGRMVKGPGDGVSDDVPAVIGGGQPAALATDEFVVPARVVAELGNGSSEAGAKKLYAMMDRVEAAARKAKRGQDSKAERFLPA